VSGFTAASSCCRVLCRVLQVELRGPPGEVLLALYVQTVQFCRRSGFSREQTSVLLSVMKRVHQLNTGEPVQVSLRVSPYR
jgi:hypothetical protein